jgi:hypothetical protein
LHIPTLAVRRIFYLKFRSKVEPMSDEEIREEIRKAEEEFRRKSKEINNWA